MLPDPCAAMCAAGKGKPDALVPWLAYAARCAARNCKNELIYYCSYSGEAVGNQ